MCAVWSVLMNPGLTMFTRICEVASWIRRMVRIFGGKSGPRGAPIPLQGTFRGSRRPPWSYCRSTECLVRVVSLPVLPGSSSQTTNLSEGRIHDLRRHRGDNNDRPGLLALDPEGSSRLASVENSEDVDVKDLLKVVRVELERGLDDGDAGVLIRGEQAGSVPRLHSLQMPAHASEKGGLRR